MYSVAIIDDEIYAIQHLLRMLEKFVPSCTVTGCFTDARQALLAPECTHADILFVDIMMPAMNGLEFSERLLQENPHAKVVLLTAYRDFEYAKKALGIGVFDYWVKHELRKTNIAELMQGVIAAVEQSRRVHYSIQRQNLMEALNQRQPLHILFPSAGSAAQYCLLYLQAGKEIPMHAYPLPEGVQFCGSFGIHSLQLAVGYVQEKQLPEALRATLERVLPEDVTGGLLSPCFTAASYQKELHSRLLAAAENCIFGRQRLVMASEDVLSRLQYDLLIPRQLEKDVFSPAEEAVRAINTEGVLQSLEPLWSNRYLSEGNRQALVYAAKRLTELLADLGFAPVPENTIEADLHAMKTGFLEAMRTFSTPGHGADSQSLKVRRIRSYIHKHLREELQLKNLTREFNISGDYLRKIFRNETGVTLSEYITQARVDEASRLLKTGEYKVYEIAEMVGYNSTHYFSQVFHKATGRYPTEYVTAME